MEFRETQLENLLSKHPQRKQVIIKEAEQSQQMIQIPKETKENAILKLVGKRKMGILIQILCEEINPKQKL